jgi:hypothetical protein
MEIVDRLIEYWIIEGIAIERNSVDKIKEVVSIKNILLPNDFIELYQKVNGMINLYPNDYDREGFLFYPVEALVTMDTEFGRKSNENLKNVILFANYLLKCWSYGLKVINDEAYEIGLISDHNTFNFITTSLSDFLTLYMEDSEKLYYSRCP